MCGCFVWALVPFLFCFAVLLVGETQIWPGDLCVVGAWLFCSVFLFQDLPLLWNQGVSMNFLIDLLAYSNVRTEPWRYRLHREKRNVVWNSVLWERSGTPCWTAPFSKRWRVLVHCSHVEVLSCEKFYHGMYSFPHLRRFQLNWGGLVPALTFSGQFAAERTFKSEFNALVEASGYGVCGYVFGRLLQGRPQLRL